MPTAALLYFDPQPDRGWAAPLGQFCALQGLRFRQVAGGELTLTLSQLAQGLLPPAGAVPPSAPNEPVFVLCGGSLDRLLAALRRVGVPPATLKAVLTPTNAGWTIPQLWAELARERASFL